MEQTDLRYLKSLAKQYPTVVSTCIKERFRGDQEKDRGRVRECHQSGRKEIDRHTDLLPGTEDGAGDKDRGEHGGLVQGHIVPPDKDLQRSVF